MRPLTFRWQIRAMLLCALLPCLAQARVICVDDDNRTPTQTGSTQYPFRSIQQAIQASVSGDTLLVAVGTYTPINTIGKSLVLLGGFAGADEAAYTRGESGNFVSRTGDPGVTVIQGGIDSAGVILTRFDDKPFALTFDNFNVKNNGKGIVCDVMVSWPLVENVTISRCIVENNGSPGTTTLGSGIIVAGNNHRILSNTIRNNHGGRGPGLSGNLSFTDSILVEDNFIGNNVGYDDHAGGVYLGGRVLMQRNTISGNELRNTYGWGGGVLILGNAMLKYNIINNNKCPTYGGGVFVDEGGRATLDHNLLYGNSTLQDGAGIAVDNSDTDSSFITVNNCTIANNRGTGGVGGNAIFLDKLSFAAVSNCICWGNGDDFAVRQGSGLRATYTLSQEGINGIGNFTADPLFADAEAGDFHVRSRGGRYDPRALTWVIDSVHSPAIDAGDPTAVYNNEPEPNGMRINLGFYGNTAAASKSFVSADISDTDHTTDIVRVHPNPVSNQAEISVVAQLHDAVLKLMDVRGAIVWSGDVLGNQRQQLDCSSLADGVYMLRLFHQGRCVAAKCIVVHK